MSNNIQSFISQTLKVVDPLVEKFDIFSTLEFDTQRDSDFETSNLNPNSIRASK